MSDPIEREAFEKWAAKRWPGWGLVRGQFGKQPEQYLTRSTQLAWESWQAARALPAARVGDVFPPMPTMCQCGHRQDDHAGSECLGRCIFMDGKDGCEFFSPVAARVGGGDNNGDFDTALHDLLQASSMLALLGPKHGQYRDYLTQFNSSRQRVRDLYRAAAPVALKSGHLARAFAEVLANHAGTTASLVDTELTEALERVAMIALHKGD